MSIVTSTSSPIERPRFFSLLYPSHFFHHDVVELCDGHKRFWANGFELSTSPAYFPNLCYVCLGWHGILFPVRFYRGMILLLITTVRSGSLVSLFATLDLNAMLTGDSDGVRWHGTVNRPGSNHSARLCIVRDIIVLWITDVIVFRLPMTVFSFAVRSIPCLKFIHPTLV